MSVKSKARRTRRATTPADRTAKQVLARMAERRAAGAIMGALLDAITFGALDPAPRSRP